MRRVVGVEKSDPVVQLKGDHAGPRGWPKARYRRQYVSSAAGARRGAAALIARVRVGIARGRILVTAAHVGAASVPNINDSLLDVVVSTAVGCAPVNGVLVVEASACGVKFRDLVAHGNRPEMY